LFFLPQYALYLWLELCCTSVPKIECEEWLLQIDYSQLHVQLHNKSTVR
jgi:hypothetical protein